VSRKIALALITCCISRSARGYLDHDATRFNSFGLGDLPTRESPALPRRSPCSIGIAGWIRTTDLLIHNQIQVIDIIAFCPVIFVDNIDRCTWSR
jgi:hypothetical protein